MIIKTTLCDRMITIQLNEGQSFDIEETDKGLIVTPSDISKNIEVEKHDTQFVTIKLEENKINE